MKFKRIKFGILLSIVFLYSCTKPVHIVERYNNNAIKEEYYILEGEPHGEWTSYYSMDKFLISLNSLWV